MVVIVIIGILAALAIPRFLGATNKAKATEFKPVLKQIYTLEEAYRQESSGGVYGQLTTIGWDAPSSTASYFWYSPGVASAITGNILTGATLTAYTGTTGTCLAFGSPSTNGQNINVNGTKLAAGTDVATVDQLGDQFSYGTSLPSIAGAAVPKGSAVGSCN
jgi:type II secretory pathway pseudopilin PulG